MTIRSALISMVFLAACAGSGARSVAPGTDPDRANVEHLLRTLAHDSMEGRGTGTPGGERAARFLMAEMKRIGLKPGGDNKSYSQLVPVYLRAATTRQTVPQSCVVDSISKTRSCKPTPGATPVTQQVPARIAVLPTFKDVDTVPADRRRVTRNVIGMIPGSDPALRNEVIIVLSHYDHLGIGRPENGDSIYNGADDDASGTVAVLEVARHLLAGPKPKRTIVFANMTGEEMGLVGTRYFLAHPTIPLERIVAGLEIEMIGRPDSLAGGPGKAWLTGYERSTMGDMLKQYGIAIVPDPRPSQNFFQRSDNYGFATRGIVAHTLSTFNLHTDYHHAGDDVDKVDFAHMTAVTRAAAEAVRHLADGPRPQWHPGGKPAASAPR
ncbi:MAG: M20/M25/M40 family metallo-hydrolase [Gemmatimonadales bacterium]